MVQVVQVFQVVKMVKVVNMVQVVKVVQFDDTHSEKIWLTLYKPSDY